MEKSIGHIAWASDGESEHVEFYTDGEHVYRANESSCIDRGYRIGRHECSIYLWDSFYHDHFKSIFASWKE